MEMEMEMEMVMSVLQDMRRGIAATNSVVTFKGASLTFRNVL
jgi:hypothetical protein